MQGVGCVCVWGVLSVSGPIRDRKRGEGGGGMLSASGIQKAGVGGGGGAGCLEEKGEVPYMKGGFATPNPPPPPPPPPPHPPIHLCARYA